MNKEKIHLACRGLSFLFDELELTLEEREGVALAELKLIREKQGKPVNKKSNVAAWTIPPALVALISIVIIAIFR